jgi:hypothetical protein
VGGATARTTGSVLSGATAAAIDGLVGFESDIIHGTMARGRRMKHSAKHLDMASSLPHDRLPRAVIVAGVQQRLVIPSQFSESLRRRGRCTRRALIVESIADAGGGIASVPEKDFDGIVRRFGLPGPSRQRIVERTGRRCYLDVDWERYEVGVEVQGAHHYEVLRADADLDRHNEITSMGRRMLMFPSRTVRHEGDVVGQVLTNALRAGGWDGSSA